MNLFILLKLEATAGASVPLPRIVLQDGRAIEVEEEFPEETPEAQVVKNLTNELRFVSTMRSIGVIDFQSCEREETGAMGRGCNSGAIKPDRGVEEQLIFCWETGQSVYDWVA